MSWRWRCRVGWHTWTSDGGYVVTLRGKVGEYLAMAEGCRGCSATRYTVNGRPVFPWHIMQARPVIRWIAATTDRKEEG